MRPSSLLLRSVGTESARGISDFAALPGRAALYGRGWVRTYPAIAESPNADCVVTEGYTSPSVVRYRFG